MGLAGAKRECVFYSGRNDSFVLLWMLDWKVNRYAAALLGEVENISEAQPSVYHCLLQPVQFRIP